MKKGLAILLLFFSIMLPSCRLPEIRPSLWPIYRTEYHPKNGDFETDILWPLFTYRSYKEKEGFHITPFFAHYDNKKEKKSESFFFYPFGYRTEKRSGEVYLRFFPFVHYTKRYPEGKKTTDFYLLPFLFMGTQEQEEGRAKSYFALFPIGGSIHRFLGKDEINFLAFPFYYTSRKGDYHSLNFLWPFFSYGWGEKGDKRALTLFPLFSVNEKDGHFQRTTILWPIFSWQRNYLYTDNPTFLFQVFPLFGRQFSKTGSSWYFLWPFFAGSSQKDGSVYFYDIAWPLFKTVKTPAVYRWQLMPLFSHRIIYTLGEKESDRRAYFWPLIWNHKENTSTYEKQSTFILPFFYYTLKNYKKDGGGKEVYYKFWPFIHASESKEGEVIFALPSPLLGKTLLGGHYEKTEKLYWPYWNIYRSMKRPNGETSTWMFFKFLSHHKGEDWELFDLPFLYGYHRKGTQKEHSFLLGLIRLKFDEEKFGISLFYFLNFFF